jgi:ATP-dependent DNA helicase RecQ
MQFGHDKLPTHGVGKHLTRPFWRRFSEGLLADGLVESAGDQFKVLRITPKGESVLYGKAGYTYAVLKGEKKAPPSKNIDEKGYNTDLFRSLKNVRTRLSNEADVPPYVIFADKSLRQMCLYYPQTEGEMLGMNGVGSAKMAKYGHEFLAEIQKYVGDHPECLEQGKMDIPLQLQPEKRKSVLKSATIMETIDLVKSGCVPDEIARRRKLKISTVTIHMESYLREGYELDIESLVEPELQQKIKDSFDRHGMEFLKPVVEELGVGYEPVRIMRGWLTGQAKE